MFLAIFRKFLALFFCYIVAGFGQSADNVVSIELGSTNFPIERPFTISIIIPNSETRATVTFPDIPGFTKKGISTSVTPVDVGGKSVTNQVITQSYQARAAGRFRLLPFTIVVDGETVRSEGATLVVQSPLNTSARLTMSGTAAKNAAFLSLRASKASIYSGEGVALTLSFFVADNYPYVLSFQALDKQLQKIVRMIRPANSWEENLPINDLKPISTVINGKKFREYRLFQSVFFPLSNQSWQLPAVSLQLSQIRPVIGPPSSQPEPVLFTSKPVAVAVRPLPSHPLRGRVPVGTFRLEEGLDRQQVVAGKSVRYTFSISGQGNVATLPAPAMLNESTEIDVFPPEERHTINQIGDEITGYKTFAYFMVPRQNGLVSLANRFQWIYFNPQTARYDTLRPHLTLQVGGSRPSVVSSAATFSTTSGSAVTPTTSGGNSLYAGIEAMDSTQQPISISSLVRAVANVLIVSMLLGTIVVLFKR